LCFLSTGEDYLMVRCVAKGTIRLCLNCFSDLNKILG